MAQETRKPYGSQESDPGPFLAKIVSHLDPSYMGILEVQLLREVGNNEDATGQLHHVKYMSPFYGVTGADFLGAEPDDYNNTQKSYGMWMIPPDVGSLVVVIFIQGDPKKGYWIGCVQDDNMNFMVPGYASTKYVNDAYTPTNPANTDVERVPTAEYNKVAASTVQDPTKYLKPVHPFVEALDRQGLLKDDIRGLTTSSARRETPSMVFGINTPGPTDKRPNAKQGKVGKAESKVNNAFVSRLGGSSFVMDDGDDKFLRKKPASGPNCGPMEYAAVEQGQTDGDVTIPHNELIRLRTRTGHQILLHNSEDLIYIGNAKGTAWIELTGDGKIDIYAADSISVHTKKDMNFYADRDINIEAGRNFNVKVGKEMHTHVLKDSILIIDANQKIKIAANSDTTVKGNTRLTTNGALDIKTSSTNKFTAGGTTHIKSGGQHIETASAIHMNGPGAAAAAKATEPKPLKTHTLPNELGKELTKSIMRRIPTPEPYPQHENLDPIKYKPEKTDRDIDGRYDSNSTSIKDPATTWKKYSTVTDTFEKLGEPNQG
jgi:hypothetical protein